MALELLAHSQAKINSKAILLNTGCLTTEALIPYFDGLISLTLLCNSVRLFSNVKSTVTQNKGFYPALNLVVTCVYFLVR